MLVFSSVFADQKVDLEKYRLYVTKVDPEFLCFELSNNLVFNIPKKNWENNTLPEVGTQVHIFPIYRLVRGRSLSIEDGEFAVVYSEDPEKKSIVWMPKESEQYCLSYVSSEPLCTQPGGWIYTAEYKEVVLLSDGSKWVMVEDALSKFKPGDRVIVSRSKEDNYVIVNIDRTIYISKGEVSTKAITFYEARHVNPYRPEEMTKE